MSTSLFYQLGFTYSIVRSKRKSAAIHVRAGQVQVRIPEFVEDKWAQEFILTKQAWIRQKLAQQDQHAQMKPVLAQGQTLLWLGQEREIKLKQKIGVELGENHIELGVAHTKADQAETAKSIQAVLERFFKQQAKDYMVPRTQMIAQQYGLQDKLANVKFRRTKTKWGHCTSKGDIQYNWLIMGAPRAVVDYLICHEVSHLKHPNHSQAFWRCVAQHCPDYKAHQTWLKQNSAALSWC